MRRISVLKRVRNKCEKGCLSDGFCCGVSHEESQLFQWEWRIYVPMSEQWNVMRSFVQFQYFLLFTFTDDLNFLQYNQKKYLSWNETNNNCYIWRSNIISNNEKYRKHDNSANQTVKSKNLLPFDFGFTV